MRDERMEMLRKMIGNNLVPLKLKPQYTNFSHPKSSSMYQIYSNGYNQQIKRRRIYKLKDNSEDVNKFMRQATVAQEGIDKVFRTYKVKQETNEESKKQRNEYQAQLTTYYQNFKELRKKREICLKKTYPTLEILDDAKKVQSILAKKGTLNLHRYKSTRKKKVRMNEENYNSRNFTDNKKSIRIKRSDAKFHKEIRISFTIFPPYKTPSCCLEMQGRSYGSNKIPLPYQSFMNVSY